MKRRMMMWKVQREGRKKKRRALKRTVKMRKVITDKCCLHTNLRWGLVQCLVLLGAWKVSLASR